MKRVCLGILVVLAFAALFGWAGEQDRRAALEANWARAWSAATWEVAAGRTER